MRLVILVLLLVVLLCIYDRCRPQGPGFHEGFQEGEQGAGILPSNDDLPQENTGPLPWQRHPVDSVPIDLIDKYPQAYYHELDNPTYMGMLRQRFAIMADRYQLGIPRNAWTDDLGQQPDLAPGYEAVVAFLQGRLEEGRGPTGPTGPTGPIQVVHDRWVSCHQARGNPQLFLYKLEVVLYRAFRSHGKHVAMDVMAERQAHGGYRFDVLGMAILGSVTEDKIALFPVRAFDPQEINEARMVGTPFTAKDLLLLDDATVKMIVDKVRENRAKEASEGRR